MSSEILNHPTIGRVAIRRNRQLKRLTIAVMPSGEVRLNVPYGADVKEAIKFMESREEWITLSKEKMAVKVEQQKRECRAVVDKNTTHEDLVELWRKAHKYLPQRLLEIMRSTGLVCSDLKIGQAMSRWGSCSTANVINLSMFLMGLPPHLIDLIIIHELCHTVHHNHSAKFHELVDKHTGGREKELEKELKGWRIKAN